MENDGKDQVRAVVTAGREMVNDYRGVAAGATAGQYEELQCRSV
jgi:hypothetical protein